MGMGRRPGNVVCRSGTHLCCKIRWFRESVVWYRRLCKYRVFLVEDCTMAYTSRAWVSGWQYDKDGTDFNAKVGNLLSGGADLQATSVAAALAAAKGTAPETSTKPPTGDIIANPYQGTSTQQTCVGPHPGYAWVDEHGRPLVVGPPADAALMNATINSTKAGTPNNTANSDSPYSTMTGTQRSMAIWKRISPGMMPDTTATPQSTTAEHHGYDPSQIEPTDFKHHLKKTDFAEYTEAALRGMQHIKAAAKK